MVGRLKLCQPHVDWIANGLNVCRPVMSAPKAKFPLPTCKGVISELAFRRGLNDRTTCRRSIPVSALIWETRYASTTVTDAGSNHMLGKLDCGPFKPYESKATRQEKEATMRAGPTRHLGAIYWESGDIPGMASDPYAGTSVPGKSKISYAFRL